MRTILVTGATKGIGLEIVRKFSRLEKTKIVGISRNSTSDRIWRLANVYHYECDLRIPAEIDKVLDNIQKHVGDVDILVNNAGIGIFRRIEELTLENWNEMLATNLTAPFVLIKKVVPKMKGNGYGIIINVQSDADNRGFAEASGYCATKHGLRGLSSAVREELRGTNIRLTEISPGRVDTHFNNKRPGDRPESLKPDDVAEIIHYIANMKERCLISGIQLTSKLEM